MRKLLAGAAAVLALSSGAVGVMAAGPDAGCYMAGRGGNCVQSDVCDREEGQMQCVQIHEQDCMEETAAVCGRYEAHTGHNESHHEEDNHHGKDSHHSQKTGSHHIEQTRTGR